MLLTDLVLLPYRATRLAVRSVGALDRFVDASGKDPFTDLAEAIREGLADLDAVRGHIDRLDRHLMKLDGHVELLLEQVPALTDQAGSLTGAAITLERTGSRVADEADDLDTTAEALEDSLEGVADTLEPLAPAAEKVGRADAQALAEPLSVDTTRSGVWGLLPPARSRLQQPQPSRRRRRGEHGDEERCAAPDAERADAERGHPSVEDEAVAVCQRLHHDERSQQRDGDERQQAGDRR